VTDSSHSGIDSKVFTLGGGDDGMDDIGIGGCAEKNSPTTPHHATSAVSSASSAPRNAADTPHADGSSLNRAESVLDESISAGRYRRRRGGTVWSVCEMKKLV
jgi:hypothetical protein